MFVPKSHLSTVNVKEVVVEDVTSFGDWLQERRNALRLTQKELAVRVGCSADYLRKIEADERRPRQIAERLAEALEILESNRATFIKVARGELPVDRLTRLTPAIQTERFAGPCPYKGLDVFEEEDAELFFGREKLNEDLIRRVKESRTVFIIGPSGSGKSSLVRAGLIPALRGGAIENLHSENWLYETMKPGRDPMGELARVISGIAKTTNAGDEVLKNALTDEGILTKWCEIALKEGRDKRAVLFIDQFEEIFTQVSNEEERSIFLNLLSHAATAKNGRVILLFVMRSDFVMNCATYPKLNNLYNQQSIQIGAMEPDELTNAIAQPASTVGLSIDRELVKEIIEDMQGEPGALPLMQFTLKDLFDSRQAKGGMIELTLSDYQNHGGIHKSLERHADRSFAQLQDNEQELARHIFSGLIEIGYGTQDTGRTALFDELIPSDSKVVDVKTVVQKLADARLITTDEQAGKDTVTISHEKLIDAWPWLKKLVNEHRDVIALQNEIADDAKEWEHHQREVSYLYTGARLANASEQLEANRLVLSGLAKIFIDSSQQAEEAELWQEDQRRQKELDDARRLAEAETKRAEIEKQRAEEQTRSATKLRQGRVYLIFALGVVVLMAIIAGIFGVTNSNLAATNASVAETAQAAGALAVTQQALAQANAEEAQKQAKIARADELAAQSVAVRDRDLSISLLLGVEAFNTWDTLQTRSVLFDNTQANPQLLAYLIKHKDWVDSVAFSPDAKILASGSLDGTIILWDVETKQPISQLQSPSYDEVRSVAFSPDGKILASGNGFGSIHFWDVETRQPVGKPLRDTTTIFSIAFSPDGKILASGKYDSTITLWDVETRQPIGSPLRHADVVNDVSFSPDGKILAAGSWDGTIILWDVETRQPIGQPLRGETREVVTIAFSPDGKILASGNANGTIILWKVDTREPIDHPLSGETDVVNDISFSPDGKILAAGNSNGTVTLWDLETRQSIGQPLTRDVGAIFSVAFSPDGKILASGSNSNTVILWNIENMQSNGQPLNKHTDVVSNVVFSPNGRMLASGGWDKTIILWDLETRQPIGQPLTRDVGAIFSVAFSPDGKILASGSDNGIITFWDVETRQPIGQPLNRHAGSVISVAFSPNGKLFASGSYDGTIILWDVETRQPIGPILRRHTEAVRSVTFSPDGEILASGSDDHEIILWDVETRQPVGQPLGGPVSPVLGIAFSPDGKILASGGGFGTIFLWNLETRQPIGQPLKRPVGSVLSVVFSPDGKILASGNSDNSVILWDVSTLLNLSVETGQPIGQLLRGHSNSVLSVAFSPDGKFLASGSMDNTIILRNVDIDPLSWIQKTCERAGRNFKEAEWVLYFPNADYRKTCEQWPLEPQVASSQTP